VLALSHAVYEEEGVPVGERKAPKSEAAAVEVGVAELGIPVTSRRFCCPAGKAEMFQAERSVIWAGAAHAALAPDGSGAVDVEDGGGCGEVGTKIVTMSVTVDGAADKVTVAGGSKTTCVSVKISVTVVTTREMDSADCGVSVERSGLYDG
jgi:hypothetical protein